MVDALQAEYMREITQDSQLKVDSTSDVSVSPADIKKMSIFFLLAMIRSKTSDNLDANQLKSASQAGEAAFEKGLAALLGNAGGDYDKIVKELKNIDTSGMNNSQKAELSQAVDMAQNFKTTLDEINKLKKEMKKDGPKEKALEKKIKKEGFKIWCEKVLGITDKDVQALADLKTKDGKDQAKINDLTTGMAVFTENMKSSLDSNAAKNQSEAGQSKAIDNSILNNMFSQQYAQIF